MTGTSQVLAGKSVLLVDIADAFGEAIATAVLNAGGRLVAGCSAASAPPGFSDACHIHDPGDPAGWQALIEAAGTRIGPLTGVVVNPQSIVRGSIEDLNVAAWRLVRAGGLDAAMHALRAALPRLRHVEGSSIVNLCSIAGELGLASFASTCATAFALRPMTRSAAVHAKEKGYATRINCVITGFERTGPLAALIPELGVDAEDVAAMVVFLLSDAAGGTTGAEFTVDGGGSLHPA